MLLFLYGNKLLFYIFVLLKIKLLSFTYRLIEFDMIKGLFYILLFYFLGEAVSILINSFIPGSVIGMILLFLSLFFGIINPKNVKETSLVITKNMAVFFVPPAVGLMAYAELISQSIWGILLAIIISTVLTIVVVALIQDYFEKHQIKRGKK